MKKINCKDGLDVKEELEARRIRKIVEGTNEDENNVVKKRVKELYKEFSIENKEQFKVIFLFYEFIKKKDKILYSAFERTEGYILFARYIFKNKII